MLNVSIALGRKFIDRLAPEADLGSRPESEPAESRVAGLSVKIKEAKATDVQFHAPRKFRKRHAVLTVLPGGIGKTSTSPRISLEWFS